MIVFVTFPNHVGTIAAIAEDPAMPRIEAMPLGRFLRANRLPRATYVLCDIERLSAHERRLVAAVRAVLVAAGLRCLNDPLRVPTRHGLLLALHRAGINPFRAWRAEDQPRPGRFPVFLRADAEHGRPLGGLIGDQAALDAAIAGLPAAGHAPAGVLVVEFCAEPLAEGTWRKLGTFRIGENYSTDHSVIEDNWCVKYGTLGLSTESMAEAEYQDVATNRFAAAVKPAFEIAGIEWGRADHATVGGREVVYEINTNPHVDAIRPQRLKRREETLRLARARMADQLRAIDTAEGEAVTIPPGRLVAEWRARSGRGGFAYRP
ncbi:hypothetical protein [Falsiroseomonas sp. HW251]|uniref:hypothetical protein n=1 Tax=Falsiroseomonas sp. HW251 TaxID=3390998 RepID=UPI003D314D85